MRSKAIAALAFTSLFFAACGDKDSDEKPAAKNKETEISTLASLEFFSKFKGPDLTTQFENQKLCHGKWTWKTLQSKQETKSCEMKEVMVRTPGATAFRIESDESVPYKYVLLGQVRAGDWDEFKAKAKARKSCTDKLIGFSVTENVPVCSYVDPKNMDCSSSETREASPMLVFTDIKNVQTDLSSYPIVTADCFAVYKPGRLAIPATLQKVKVDASCVEQVLSSELIGKGQSKSLVNFSEIEANIESTDPGEKSQIQCSTGIEIADTSERARSLVKSYDDALKAPDAAEQKKVLVPLIHALGTDRGTEIQNADPSLLKRMHAISVENPSLVFPEYTGRK